MLKLVTLEFSKLKRSQIIYIAVVTMFLFFLCATAQGIKSNYSAERLMDETIQYGTFFIIPALLAMVGSYMISREKQDDTLKSLMMIPVNIDELIAAKLIASLIIGILLVFFLFLFTIIGAALIHSEQITIFFTLKQLKNYLLQGIGCFIAVSPIICFMTVIKNGYWLSIIFGEMYSFTGLIAGSSKYRNIYPISAAFGFSGVNRVTVSEYFICLLSLFLSALISWMILRYTRDYRLEMEAY